jgi:hypothetical protein
MSDFDMDDVVKLVQDASDPICFHIRELRRRLDHLEREVKLLRLQRKGLQHAEAAARDEDDE